MAGKKKSFDIYIEYLKISFENLILGFNCEIAKLN